MTKIHTKDFEVRSYDVDARTNLKPSKMFAYIQEAAWKHANELGIGWYDIQKNHNGFWAISRLNVNIIDYPKWDDIVQCKTWPVNVNRLFARRDFEIYNNGKLCVSATSEWIIADINTRHLLEPCEVANHAGIEFTEGIEGFSANKLRFKLTEKANVKRKMVRYSDLDMNQHLNSIRYLEWCMNCLPAEWYADKSVKSFSINYLKEVAAGSGLDLSYQINDDLSVVFQGTVIDSDKLSILVKLDFEKC